MRVPSVFLAFFIAIQLHRRKPVILRIVVCILIGPLIVCITRPGCGKYWPFVVSPRGGRRQGLWPSTYRRLVRDIHGIHIHGFFLCPLALTLFLFLIFLETW